jgi:threonylcarbamoyladenosine tRNA methylthiotransferase MtaB
MRAAFYTLGCKLNQFETEALASAFRSRGFFIVARDAEADVYIINTCTVTSKSEQKARRIIRKIENEHAGALVIVTGCYVELEEETLRREFPRAVFVPQHSKPLLLSAAENMAEPFSPRQVIELISGSAAAGLPFAYDPRGFEFHSRAYIKIQDGCDNRCAYCRVPLARGNSVSIGPRRALGQLAALEAAGYTEAIVTGVTITSYSSGDTDLPGLLRFFLENTASIRLRISSLEPDMIGDELLSVLADKRIRPHFHIPIQSGSDRVLKLMKRKYTADIVKKAAAGLREIQEDPFIGADIITGFPGEGEDDYQRTRKLVEELQPAQLHVFQFSPRPGTAARDMKPKVPQWKAKERSAELRELSEGFHEQYTDRWRGKKVEGVVVRAKGGRISVLTENYLEAAAEKPGDGDISPGALCSVRIEKDGDKVCFLPCSVI